MIIYFAIYSFLGYLLESLYVSFFQKKWISSGLLKGPFIPLYGFGACLLIYVSPYLKPYPLFSFFIGGCLITLLEFLSSYFIEKCFHTKCWDYSHHRFQFKGRICLSYFLLWCFLSYLFIYYVHPFIMQFSLVNDTVCIFALIYLSFISKSLINRLQIETQQGLNIH